MRILGVAGRRRAGKDTIINGLGRLHFPTVRVEWAAEIKRCAARWYGLTPEQIDGALKEVVDPRWGRTPRDIMRAIGTEVGRHVHPETWTRLLFSQEIPTAIRGFRGDLHALADTSGWNGLVLVSGTRFPEEVDAIHAAGGRVVRVTRPGLALDEGDNHASEAGIDTLVVDADVVNDGTQQDLAMRVSALVEQWWPGA